MHILSREYEGNVTWKREIKRIGNAGGEGNEV